jgi:hypothetical protein
MKKTKNIKYQIISLLIVFSILYLPFFSIPKTEAQGLNDSPNLGSYIKDLTPVIQTLPLCKQALTNHIGSIFSKGTGNDIKGITDELIKSSRSKTDRSIFDLNEYLDEKTFEGYVTDDISLGLNSVSFVPTRDEEVLKQGEEILEQGEETLEGVSSIEANDTCLKSIGRLVIKRVLQKITTATADWITSGFNGGPAFVQDPGQFFKDLAKNEILQFGSEINNPELYPFGKSFLVNVANSYKSTFAQNARYSLDELIKEDNPNYSASGFMNDFSQGGWDAWLYMTQNPANNPLGFNLMASNELSKRIENIDQQTQNQLNQSGGFLGDIRCVNPAGVTQEEHQEALKERSTNSSGPYNYRKCEKWEYVTPGAIVANAATKLVDYPDNNLLKADDLNDALAVLVDALISKGFSYLTEKGLAYLNEASSEGNYDLSGYSPSQIYGDYTSFVIEASSWLKQNPGFNIRTDLNQAVIDEQRTYIEKLKEQNKELEDLILVTRQLDYCIPGPNPRWENESWERLNDVLYSIPSFEEARKGESVFWGIVQKYVPLGIVYKNIKDRIQGITQKPIKEYHASIIELFIEKKPKIDDGFNNHLASRAQTENIIKIIFSKYANIIKDIYTENPDMPLVTQDAYTEYLKIPGYQKIINQNQTKISSLNVIIGRLNSIKTEMDKLNKNLESGTSDQNKYEENLKPILDVFGRMSVDMVSGDNIANVDNVYKQVKDKKEYIYKDLLKGPYGCEKELEDNKVLPWQFFTVKRMEPPYLDSLLYDYNILPPNSIIPDPWKSGYINEMPKDTQVYGPAFLTYTAYVYTPLEGNSDPNYYPNYLRQSNFKNHETKFPGSLILTNKNGELEETPIPANPSVNILVYINGGDELFKDENARTTTVGRGNEDCKKSILNYNCNGNFEYVINVY